MKAASLLIAALLLPLVSFVARSLTPSVEVVIDLAEQQEGGSVVRPLGVRGDAAVSIVIANTVPRFIYDVALQVDDEGIAPITLDRATSTALRDGGGALSNFYGGALQRLDTVRDERSIQALRSGLYAQFSGTGTARMISDSMNALTTYRVAGEVKVSAGERLVVLVRRRASAGERERTWTTIFTTGPRGRWLISLGFGVPVLLNREQEFFTERDTADRYIIHRKGGDQSIKVIPALFFHWLAGEAEGSEFSYSLMGGLGFDMRNAVLFLGLSATYNQNITIAVGGVAHRLRQLNGRYHEGGSVLEDLDDDQLHEEVYRINPFIGLSFRFGDNGLMGR